MQKSKFYKIAEDEQIEFTINSTYKYPQRINKVFLIFGIIWTILPTVVNTIFLTQLNFKTINFHKELFDFITLNQGLEVYMLVFFQLIGTSLILFSLKIDKTPGDTHIITDKRMMIVSSIDCNSYTWDLFLPKIEIEDDALLLKLRTGKMVKAEKDYITQRIKKGLLVRKYMGQILN